MAPSPEHDKEPKAPDKRSPAPSDQVTIDILPDDPEPITEPTPGASCANPSLEGNSQLESLDEGGLKELLQEAIAYKNPKDREGKSRLFNVLLEQAEQFEEGSAAFGCRGRGGDRRSVGGGRGSRCAAGGATPRRDLPHSGSLQDLAAAAAPLSHAPAVSHRAHSGGSLPCVGRAAPTTDYVATVRCVNPPPLERHLTSPGTSSTVAPFLATLIASEDAFLHSQTSDEAETDTTADMDVSRTPKLPRIPVTYTARASLEIGAGSTGSRGGNSNRLGNRGAVTTTTSSLIDSTVGFGCITTPQVITSSSSSSCSTTTPIIDAKPVQLVSGYSMKSISGNGSSPTSPPAGHTNITHHPIHVSYQPITLPTKTHDENGNSVQSFSHPFSTASSHLKKVKPNRKKNKETEVTMADQIAGYQGFKEIDDILKFIEPELENNKHHHHKGTLRSANKSRDDGDDKVGKKRSTERRAKEKVEPKIKKANSMEEMSCSKLEDLTSDSSKSGSLTLRKTKKQSTFDSSDGQDKKNDRRSWGNESRDMDASEDIENPNQSIVPSATVATNNHPNKQVKKKVKSTNKGILSDFQTYEGNVSLPEPLVPFETLEFQTVTKKKKNKKRHSPYDENRGRGNKSYGAYPKEYLPTKNTNAEMLYSFRGQGSPELRRKSASSVPPSDKSNDSNDDLDSVHSLPVESTAEKMSLQQVSASSGGTPQASYADITRMANAVPPLINNNNPISSPPNVQSPTVSNVLQDTTTTPVTPNNNSNGAKNADKWPSISPKTSIHSNSSSPPNGVDTSSNSSSGHSNIKSPPATMVSPPQIRGHNIPDLIESCNYYGNAETPLKTSETDKNSYQKEALSRCDSNAPELTRSRPGKLKIVDIGTQVETNSNPTYDIENYPALEVKANRTNTPKTKPDNRLFKSPPLSTPKPTDKKPKVNIVKPTTKEIINEETSLTAKDAAELLTDTTYMTFVKQTIGNNIEPITVVQFEHSSKNANILKTGMLHYKLDGILNKPPDVVLPVAEISHDSLRHPLNDHRPAVVILNEEVKISTENINDIDGLTFGFDINEQLLNGEVSSKSSLENLNTSDGNSSKDNSLLGEGLSDAEQQRIPYNFNVEFPAINEKPHREGRSEKQRIHDEHRHMKKPGRGHHSHRESSKSISESEENTKENISTKDLNNRNEMVEIINRKENVAKCDLLSDSALKMKSLTNLEVVEAKLANDISVRYLAPINASNASYNLDKIVHFVGMAWEDVMKSPSDKVQYFGKKQ